MKERRSSRLWWLLLVLLGVAMAPGLLMRGSREDPDGPPTRPSHDERSCSFHVGDRRYLARDETDDGSVDCFYTVGLTHRGYRATDFDGRCVRRKLGSLKPMDETMRLTLNRILELRVSQQSWMDYADDVDADGTIDCVRSAPGGRVLVTFEGGRCEAGDQWTETGDEERREAWDEILQHENRVRALLAD